MSAMAEALLKAGLVSKDDVKKGEKDHKWKKEEQKFVRRDDVKKDKDEQAVPN